MLKKLVLLSILLSTNTFADNLFYCPETIVCAEAGNINSCQMVGGNPEAWENMQVNGKVQVGTYSFSYAAGVYQINPADAPWYLSGCGYYNRSGKITTNIGVTLKKSYDLEAHVTDNNEWWVSGDQASCNTVDAKNCPYDLMSGKK